MAARPKIEFKPGSVLLGPSGTYVVKSMLGSGAYGKVLLCENSRSHQKVAIKAMNQSQHHTTIQEINILRELKSKGGQKHNIVSLRSSFMFKECRILEFKHLDISLAKLLECGPLPLYKIRPILQQLASGLKFLRDCHVIHGDLKPDNVMIVDHKTNLQLKIIDFSLAKRVCETTPTDVLQALWYRAPEVLLGLKYGTAVDLWSLGCMAVEMLLGQCPFPGSCEHDMLRHIGKTVAFPPTDLLEKGLFTKKYFEKKDINGASIWELKPMLPMDTNGRTLNKLEDLFTRGGPKTNDEVDRKLDLKLFVDLVTKLLQVDPRQRMSAKGVLMYPFTSMSHLEGVFHTAYSTLCVDVMKQNTGCSEEDGPSTSANLQGASQPPPLGHVNRTTPASTKARGVQWPVTKNSSCDASTTSSSVMRRREEVPFSNQNRLHPYKRLKETGYRREQPLSGCDPSAASGCRKRSCEKEPLSDSHRFICEPNRFKKTKFPQEESDSKYDQSTSSGSRKRRREEEPLSDSHRFIQPPKMLKKTEYSQELPLSTDDPTSSTGSRKRRREEEPLRDLHRLHPYKRFKETEYRREQPLSGCDPSAASGCRKRSCEKEPLSDSHRFIQPPRMLKKTEYSQELPLSTDDSTSSTGSRKRRREEEPLRDLHRSHPHKRFKETEYHREQPLSGCDPSAASGCRKRSCEKEPLSDSHRVPTSEKFHKLD